MCICNIVKSVTLPGHPDLHLPHKSDFMCVLPTIFMQILATTLNGANQGVMDSGSE